MTYAAERVLADVAQYQGEWAEIYAPIRKMLAGDWDTVDCPSQLHIRFDAARSFQMECVENGARFEGTYTVVAHDDHHYLALLANSGQMFVLRIEDVDRTSAVLGIETEEGGYLRLKRRAASLMAA